MKKSGSSSVVKNLTVTPFYNKDVKQLCLQTLTFTIG